MLTTGIVEATSSPLPSTLLLRAEGVALLLALALVFSLGIVAALMARTAEASPA